MRTEASKAASCNEKLVVRISKLKTVKCVLRGHTWDKVKVVFKDR